MSNSLLDPAAVGTPLPACGPSYEMTSKVVAVLIGRTWTLPTRHRRYPTRLRPIEHDWVNSRRTNQLCQHRSTDVSRAEQGIRWHINRSYQVGVFETRREGLHSLVQVELVFVPLPRLRCQYQSICCPAAWAAVVAV